MTENNKKITFLLTGGTIDSVFDAPSERKILKQESGIPVYLENIINPHFECEFKKIFMIDSAQMTNEHRAEILSTIQKCKSSKIIVTHGTDTMCETAKYLAANIEKNEKTIILTGSIIPLDGFYQSDAPFNLGYAMAQIENKPAGIFVAMNGHCFEPFNAYKIKETGRFDYKKAS